MSRRFGWDTHGVPIEYEIDKKLGISGRDAVMQMGIEKYNEECKAVVMKYSAEWRHTIERLGRWIDFDNDYKVCPSLRTLRPFPFRKLHEPYSELRTVDGRRVHGVLLVGVQAALRQGSSLPGIPDHAVLDSSLHTPQSHGVEAK